MEPLAFPVESPPEAPAERSVRAVLALALIALVAAGLGRSLAGEFVYDDVVLVAQNPRLSTLGGLLEGMLRPHWGFEDPHLADQIGFWRPLTLLALALGRVLGGGSPVGFHAVSLALHALATLAAWRLAGELFGRGRSASRVTFLVAAAFALHPVHVESTAWISAVNDPLFGGLALASLASWLGWRRRGSPGLPWKSSILLGLSLLAKEQALAIVPCFIALDAGLWLGAPPSARRAMLGPRSLARALGLPLAAVALWVLARALVFDDPLAGFDRPGAHFGLGAARSATLRVELFGGFLRLLLWPAGSLAVFRPVRPEITLDDPTFLVAGGLLALWLVTAVIAWRRRWPRAVALALLVPASLSPVLAHYEAAGAFPLSDRYLYVTAFVPPAFLALAARGAVGRRLATLALAGLALAYGFGSWRHVQVFSDDETFFREAVRSSPKSPYVRWGLGRVLLDRYRIERERELLDEAFLHFLTSLSLGTDYGEAGPNLPPDAPLRDRLEEMRRLVHETRPEDRRPDPSVMVGIEDRLQANLGQGWCYLFYAELSPERDLETPLHVFREAARVFPWSYRAWTGLGTTRTMRGEHDLALEAFGKALELNRAHPEAWHNLAQTHLARGAPGEARRAFEEALRWRPDHLEDMIGAATAAMAEGRDDLARQMLERARDRHPDSLEPPFWRGMLAARQRDFPSALGWFDRVIARSPHHARAHRERGKVLLRLGEEEEALEAFGRACELASEDFEAHYNLGSLLLARGRNEPAIPYLTRAYSLAPSAEQREPLHGVLVELVGQRPNACYELAQASAKREDWLHALDWMELALAEGGDFRHAAAAYHGLGRIQERLERPLDAAASYKQSLEIDPEQFWAHHDLALLLAWDLDRGSEARPHAEHALRLLPEVPVDESLRRAVRGALEGVKAGEGPPPAPIEAREVERR